MNAAGRAVIFILPVLAEIINTENTVKNIDSFAIFIFCIAFAPKVCYTGAMKYLPYKLPTAFTVEKLVTVHYFELSRHFSYPPETHDFWELHYVDKGTAISVSDGERITLKEGDILFHPPMTEHQLLAAGEDLPNVCVISFYTKPRELSFLGRQKLRLSAEERGVMKRLLREAGALFDLSESDPTARGLTLRDHPPFGAAQMVRLCMEELLLLLGRDRVTPTLVPARITLQDHYADPLVRDMITYMQEHITENVGISDLCRHFSYGKTHLCTKFQAATGKSINRYFMEMKISAAKRIIRQESGTRELFSRISDLLGFSSPSYFYATFKRITNMTPTQYFKSVHQYDFERDNGAKRGE